MGWLRKIVRFLNGSAATERMVYEYTRDFPGRCLPCRYQIWGIQNGMAKPGSRPLPHDCIEPHLFSAPKADLSHAEEQDHVPVDRLVAAPGDEEP
jgi:hypothetical protein